MKEEDVMEMIESLGKKLPKFDDGRINYSTSDTAPVVTVFVSYNGKILLLRRSDKVLTYKGMWNAVAGYLDEPKPVRDKALEEVREELGIEADNISKVVMGEPYDLVDPKIGKTWRVCPILILLKQNPEIKLDYENTEYAWINPSELGNFETVPGLDRSLDRILFPK